MTNDLKKQFLEIKQEKDPILRLEKLKTLRKETILLILNEDIKPKINDEVQKLLDPKSICKN